MAYILSPQARDTLKNIRDYTLENHGKRQTKIYLSLLRDQMSKAAANPVREGRNRADIKTGYYSMIAGKHHIYFRIRGADIEIIDLLHQRMLPTNYI